MRLRRVFPPGVAPRLSPKVAGGEQAESFGSFVGGEGARSSGSEESLVRDESVRTGESSPGGKNTLLKYQSTNEGINYERDVRCCEDNSNFR